MRSRLEARWAAFFDAMKWPWSYEGLELDGYIPDFCLEFDASPRVLVEVKGPPPLTAHGDACTARVPRLVAGSTSASGF